MQGTRVFILLFEPESFQIKQFAKCDAHLSATLLILNVILLEMFSAKYARC